MGFYYVYILQSLVAQERFYVGLTTDLKKRLDRHNRGTTHHTAKYRPWRIKTAIAFTDVRRAIGFEHYLKSASGRAFVRKRL